MLTYLNGRYTSVCITGDRLDSKVEAPVIWEQLGFYNRRKYRDSKYKHRRAVEAFKRVLGALDRKAWRHHNAEVENGTGA
jgi:hypothetical protein